MTLRSSFSGTAGVAGLQTNEEQRNVEKAITKSGGDYVRAELRQKEGSCSQSQGEYGSNFVVVVFKKTGVISTLGPKKKKKVDRAEKERLKTLGREKR